MKKATTLRDVAERAQVSTTTASFVLAGKGRISPDIRRQVLQAAEELGYRKAVRKVPAPAPTVMLGVLFSIDPVWALAFGFMRPLIENLEKFFAARHQRLVLIPISDAMTTEELFERVMGVGCRGLFTIHYGNEALFSRLESRDIPVVLINNSNFQKKFTTACVDDYQGAYEGAHHLLEAGHRRLLFLDSPIPDLPVLSVDRYIGFKKAVDEFDLPPERALKLVCDRGDADHLREALTNVFQRPDRPTALFALDDDLAVRALAVLASLGLKCPDDVSVIAPGDLLDYDQPHNPQLTTLQIDTGLMGTIACGLMESRLTHQATGVNVLKVKQQMVLRGSTRSVSEEKSQE